MDQNITAALQTTNRLISLVDDAESQFKSARNWSILDLFGGGFLVDMIKHHKLGQASSTMEEVNYLLQELGRQLGNINIPDDYRVQLGGFVTFADFFFDGIVVDAYMTSKILSSLEEVRKLKRRLYELESRLEKI